MPYKNHLNLSKPVGCLLAIIFFLQLGTIVFGQAGQATRTAKSDPTGIACDANSPELLYNNGRYTCVSSAYALTSVKNQRVASSGAKPTCDASRLGQVIIKGYGNRSNETCKLMPNGSTYAWVDENPVIDVQIFGAIPNDGLDDSAAFQAAFAELISQRAAVDTGGWTGRVPTFYIPRGGYDVDVASASLLVPTAGLGVRGVVFKGDGAWATHIRVSGANYFLYNDNSLGFSKFEDLSFYGVTGNERLMYYNSSGTAQNIHRRNVHVLNFAQLYNIQGSGNADYNTHVECDDAQSSGATLAWIALNNTQSVVHSFIGVHLIVYYRGIHATAGGQVNWYGGGVLVNGTGTFAYIDDVAGSGIGTTSGEFVFSGIKSELRDTAKLLYVRGGGIRVILRDSGLTTRSNDPDDAIHVQRLGRVKIDNCSLDYKIKLTSQNDTYADTEPALVQVVNSQILRAKDVLVSIAHTGANVGGKGKAIFQGCTLPQGDGAWPTLTRVPADGTIGYNQAFSNATRPEFIAIYQALPDGRGLTNATSTTFPLPKNCFVFEVTLVNTASAAKQWTITGPSGAVWLTSASGAKMNRATVMEEVGVSNTFAVQNVTDNTFADGYIIVRYY